MLNDEEKPDLSILEFLYKKYERLMFKQALNVLHNETDAEDAVQQSCLKLIPYLNRINCEQEGMTYNFIKTVVRNTAKDVYKKKIYLNNKEDVVDNLSEDKSDFYAEVTDVVISNDSVRIIKDCINRLPDKYKEIIMLEKIYEFSREDTMKILGESYETLKKRMTRAKSKLLELLKEEEVNNGRESIR